MLLFLGVVRNHHEGRSVVSIDYEAYQAMAEGELLQLRSIGEARNAVEFVNSVV